MRKLAILMIICTAHIAVSDDQFVVATWNCEWFFDDDTADDPSNIGRDFAPPSPATDPLTFATRDAHNATHHLHDHLYYLTLESGAVRRRRE